MTFSARLRGLACLRPLLVLSLMLAPHSAKAQEEVRVGYAFLTLDSEGRSPVASALFSLRNASGTLVSEAGVSAVRPLRAGRIFVDQDGTRTGLALANPSAESVAVNLVVRDSRGNGLAQAQISLGARQHQAQFVDELFPDLPAGFVGSLTFSTSPDQEVAAVTLRLSVNRFGEPLFATLPVAALDDGAAPAGPGNAPVTFPHLGAGGGILSTQIILINRSGGTVRGRIEFTGVDGSPLEVELNGASGSVFPYELRPDGAYRATLTRAAGVVQGYAAVTVEGAGVVPAGTAIFQFRDALPRDMA